MIKHQLELFLIPQTRRRCKAYVRLVGLYNYTKSNVWAAFSRIHPCYTGASLTQTRDSVGTQCTAAPAVS